MWAYKAHLHSDINYIGQTIQTIKCVVSQTKMSVFVNPSILAEVINHMNDSKKKPCYQVL